MPAAQNHMATRHSKPALPAAEATAVSLTSHSSAVPVRLRGTAPFLQAARSPSALLHQLEGVNLATAYFALRGGCLACTQRNGRALHERFDLGW